MKKFFFAALALLMTGCATPYIPLTVSHTHPGSFEAEESPMYPASTTLDEEKEELTSKQTTQKSVHSGHNINSMSGMDSSMEGMNHASH